MSHLDSHSRLRDPSRYTQLHSSAFGECPAGSSQPECPAGPSQPALPQRLLIQVHLHSHPPAIFSLLSASNSPTPQTIHLKFVCSPSSLCLTHLKCPALPPTPAPIKVSFRVLWLLPAQHPSCGLYACHASGHGWPSCVPLSLFLAQGSFL